MITSDLQEINLDDLNPFEGDASLLLTENPEGLWKALEFDPSTIMASTHALALVDNKIVSVPVGGGGGGGTVELTGAITGIGLTGVPITTLLGSTLEIDTDLQTFNLNDSQATTFEYVVQDAGVDTFTRKITKGSDFIEETTDFSNLSFSLRTSSSGKFLWNNEIDVSPVNTNSKFSTDLSGDSSGNAFAIWSESLGGNDYEVRVSLYDSQTSIWGVSSVLNIPSQGASSTVIDSNESGNAIAAWERIINANVIQVSSYDSGTQTWSTAIDISTNFSSNPKISMSENGNGVVVWELQNAGQFQILASIYDGATWGSQSTVTPLAIGINSYQVEMDSSGNAVVTYSELLGSGGIPEVIRSVTYDSGAQTWNAPVDLSDPLESSTNPSLSLDPATGDAMCVWEIITGGGASSDIQFSSYNAGTQIWSVASNVNPPSNLNISPVVALDPQGNAICVWGEIDFNSVPIMVVYNGSNYDGASWSAPQPLYSSSSSSSSFNISSNSSGNGVYIYSDANEQINSISYISSNKSWSIPSFVSPRSNLFSGDIGLIVSDNNTSMVTWVIDESPNRILLSDTAVFSNLLFSVSDEKITFEFNRVQEVGQPVGISDAATKEYVDIQTGTLLMKFQDLEAKYNALIKEGKANDNK